MRKKVLFLCCYVVGGVLLQAQLNPYRYEVRKKATGKKGVVVSAHPLASDAGIQILKKGGNAVDAAIAVQLALAVVYPVAGNLGGGGFMLANLKGKGVKVLDFRETAPQQAYKNMYTDKDNSAYRYAQDGALAAGVPGSVSGFFAAMAYARLDVETLIAPAIRLAEKGFVITEMEAKHLNKLRSKFIRFNSYRIPMVKPNRGQWRAGDTLIQTELAQTLKRIRDKGAQGFYEGKTAELIVAEMQRLGGIITLSDLKNYRTRERTAIQFPYRKDYTILTMPPPSSGGIILQQVLTVLDQHREKIKHYAFHTPEFMNLMLEAERRAYADKSVYIADPDFVSVPLRQLTDSAYLAGRMRDFVSGRAGDNRRVREGRIKESEETTHLNVADAEGNIVSVTTTLNGKYGSCVMVRGAGFFLNNEMDDFTTLPGQPNLYGAIDGDNNAIAPGKRMLSSMSPTLVLKHGRPFLAVGTPGGTTIPTSVLQTILNITDFNMETQAAVDAPRFHFQRLPDTVFVERAFDKSPLKKLKQMGYTILERKDIGKVEAIRFLSDGVMEGAADRRGDDDARAF